MGSTHSLPQMIVEISTTQDNDKDLPLSDDTILPTTSQMTSTLSLSSDKPHLKFSTLFTVRMLDCPKPFPRPLQIGFLSEVLYTTGISEFLQLVGYTMIAVYYIHTLYIVIYAYCNRK